MASRRRKHALGMTLLTVLVITAVVAILAAVLFPVIVGPPLASSSAKCISPGSIRTLNPIAFISNTA